MIRQAQYWLRTKLTLKSDRTRIHCPMCGRNEAVTRPDMGVWHCFGCNRSGEA